MGRPKKYTPSKIKKIGLKLILWAKEHSKANEVFWLKDFCIENKFPSEYLSVWSKQEGETSEFSQSLKMAKDMQEMSLAHAGMSKEENTTFIIFALKNTAGWRDAQEMKHSGMIFDGKIDYASCSLEQLTRLRMGDNPLEVLRPDQIK